jgi:hypothetical protein
MSSSNFGRSSERTYCEKLLERALLGAGVGHDVYSMFTLSSKVSSMLILR